MKNRAILDTKTPSNNAWCLPHRMSPQKRRFPLCLKNAVFSKAGRFVCSPVTFRLIFQVFTPLLAADTILQNTMLCKVYRVVCCPFCFWLIAHVVTPASVPTSSLQAVKAEAANISMTSFFINLRFQLQTIVKLNSISSTRAHSSV